jgi:hypothetical protein
MAVLSTALHAADQSGLDHTAGLEGLAGFVFGGLDHVPAAPGADGDDAARSQPHQGFAHDGAAAVEQHRKWLLTQARAGG